VESSGSDRCKSASKRALSASERFSSSRSTKGESTASSSRMPRRALQRSRERSVLISREKPSRLMLALDHHLLDLGDRLAGIQVLRAILRAVQDRVAAVEAERILERVEPLAGRLVAAVDEPPVRLQQRRRTQVAVRVPPVARARGRAARAENARGRRVDPLLILFRLQTLVVRRRRRLRL